MNFIEHIKKLDEIIDAIKAEEYKRTLFQTQAISGAGLGFTHISTVQNGNMTNISVSSNGATSRYTMISDATGILI